MSRYRACTTRMLSVAFKRQPGNENVSLKALENGSSDGLPIRILSIGVWFMSPKIQGWMRRRFRISFHMSTIKSLHSKFLLETLSIWWDKHQFWHVWINNSCNLWQNVHWASNHREFDSLHCAVRCHHEWWEVATIHCIHRNKGWLYCQEIKIIRQQSTTFSGQY